MYLLFFLLAAAAPADLEVPIPPNSVKLAEPGRYKTYRTFEATLDFFQDNFPKEAVRFIPIVNLPSIKAEHIQSLKNNTRFEGINVYEARGEVRFYIVPRK